MGAAESHVDVPIRSREQAVKGVGSEQTLPEETVVEIIESAAGPGGRPSGERRAP